MCAGYAVDPTASSAVQSMFPTHTHTPTHTHIHRVIGERERAAKTVSTGVKRKRLDKGDPGEVDGYEGPWRA